MSVDAVEERVGEERAGEEHAGEEHAVNCSVEEGGEVDEGDDALPPPEVVARATGCFRCHAVFDVVVGPAYLDVARRYRDDPGARERLIGIVQHGGKGHWTEITRGVPMPPHSNRLTEPLVAHLVDWVLGLDDEPDETMRHRRERSDEGPEQH